MVMKCELCLWLNKLHIPLAVPDCNVGCAQIYVCVCPLSVCGNIVQGQVEGLMR